MRFGEFPAVLRRDQSTAVVDAALHERVTGIVFLLCLEIYYESDILIRPGHSRVEFYVIPDGLLEY